MTDRRQSLRPTGLPKPSRLPMMSPALAASSTSSIPTPCFSSSTSRPLSVRPIASRESLSGSIGGPVSEQQRASKLRPVSSRSRLSLPPAPSPSASSTSNSGIATPKTLLRQPSASRLTAHKTPRAATTTPVSTAHSLRRSNDTNVLQRPATKPLSRRTSNQQLIQPTSVSTSPIDDPPSNIVEEKESGLGLAEEALIGEAIREKARGPRPSLSERTIETLASIPSSPAVKGRTSQASSFYDPDVLRRPPSRPGSRSTGSRPGSSYQSDNSSNKSGSRPHSQHGQEDNAPNFRASTNTFRSAGLPSFLPIDELPGGRSSSVSSSSRTLRAPSSRTSLGPGFAGARRSLGPGAKPPGPPTKSVIPQRSRTPSPEKKSAMPGPSRSAAAPGSFASKSLSARPLKPRPSLNGLLPKPSMSNLGSSTRNSSMASRTSSTSYDTSNVSSASTVLTADSAESASPPTGSRKSSAALREQIAKAKAAKRAALRQVSKDSTTTSPPLGDPPVVGHTASPTPGSFSHSVSSSGGGDEVPLIPTDTTFDFGLAGDPFGQKRNDKALAKIIQTRVEAARTSGRLNIAALGLKDIPNAVTNMYNADAIRENGGSWAESVDLTRFVGADNDIEAIDDSVFPDIDPEQVDDSEDGHGNIFGGLETLDLHGNALISLPLGLRRLSLLTSLNLAQNRITNNALEVISQITSLRDLKLGGNLFYGPLDPCFAKLENLEIADLHGNNISALPLNLSSMTKLRILNISENDFDTLLFEPLSQLPLTELIARKNRLSGVLIGDSVTCLPKLQVLDVSANQITHLVSPSRTDTLDLPALYQLCVTMNRLQELPNVGSWSSLLTLSADENNINCIPAGFTALSKLRHVDFSSNDIRVIPSEIGRMESLAMLRLGGNPLRDKKFCTATTEDLKETLLGRLEPAIPPEAETTADGLEDELRDAVSLLPVSTAHHRERSGAESVYSESETFATPPTSAPHTPVKSHFQHASVNSISSNSNSQLWPVKSDGVLDRSETESSALHPVIASRVAQTYAIRTVYLQKNMFTVLPDSLSFFAETLTVLSLARNQLSGESYLGDASVSLGLDLPVLTELNLSSNYIASLTPLVQHLRAPRLQKLDVSMNRVSILPGTQSAGTQVAGTLQQQVLRDVFPELAVLLAANNHLVALDPDSIRGMRVVDVSNNDIEHLDPRIGLLGSGGSGGHGGSSSGTLQRLDVSGNRFRVPRYNVLERGTEATLRWLRGRVPIAEMATWRAANQPEANDDDVD